MEQYHFIGIKGSGMASLACIFYDLGYEITGSDKPDYFFTQKSLDERGVAYTTFDVANIKQGQIIVRGTAFDDSNVEVMEAKRLGLPMYDYHEAVGLLTKKLHTVAICGCHGKTTTTKMMEDVFSRFSDVNYLIGDGTGHGCKDSHDFILEACEYKRHFLYYYPDYTILTNIELDHIDYYKDIEDVRSAYEAFANQTKLAVVACGDDEEVRKMKTTTPIYYYGLKEDNDIVASNVVRSSEGTSFDCYIRGTLYGHFDLPIFGDHMLQNALGVIGVAYLKQFDVHEVEQAILGFVPPKRRFVETKIGDLVLIDDYAHHPTEVRVTIEGARHKYPEKTIVAIFEAHTSSRVKRFSQEFADALNLADYAYVAPIYNDRKDPDDTPDVTSNLIISKLHHGDSITYDEPEKLLVYQNAVLLFMSSKSLYKLKEKYEALVSQHQ